MRKYLLIGSVMIIFAFFVQFEPLCNEPPDPRVEIKGQSILTVQGTFCWSGMFRGQCVDKIYADGLHMTEKSNPVTLKNKQLVIPKKSGTYAYELQARWSENGDDQFAFLIMVK
ncbi:hypothetical protein [Exiguobacterium sp. s80]|uniref:hypothetical protein n=1 Tax=Exiguobacterium sp. s80 TaxID=2751209 RepID=UPI001BEA0872|nr:hypothetical protein [Exiguobacterium sp. s80]